MSVPTDPTPPRPPGRPATRPEHSEVYWQLMKYLILALLGLMILAVALAIAVLTGIILE